MSISVVEALFLVAAGAVAAVIGSAGGITSLISYPALLAVGIAPLPANVTSTSKRCDGRRSLQKAPKKIQASPIAINTRIRRRPCVRKPLMSAAAPNVATALAMKR